MSDFLTINGIPISVRDNTSKVGYEVIGVRDRVLSTKMRDARRGIKRKHSFTTTPYTLGNWDCLVNMILGRGVHWGFQTSACSDQGVVPTTGYTGVTIGTGVTSAKFGSSIRMKVASGGSITYQVLYQSADTNESVMFWFWNGATWDHYAITSAGDKYKNGATFGTAITAVTLSNGPTLMGKAITGGASADAYYNDLVWLPWSITAAMVAAHYAGGVRWGPCTRVNMNGTLIRETGPIECLGTVDGLDHMQANLGSGFAPNNGIINFTLTEV